MNDAKEYILQPDYFSEFHCLASGCHNDCCHGWRINVPRPCYMKIRSTRKSPELEELVSKGIRRNKKANSSTFFAGIQLDEKGDCVFLNEERMCRLQIECGPGVLPYICQDFPRRAFRSGNLILLSCTPACEEVVNLLWARPDGLEFLAAPREKGILRISRLRTPEGSQTLYSHFEEIQWVCISILQNRSYTLDERMILLGIAVRALAKIQSTTEDAAVQDWLTRYTALTEGSGFKAAVEKLPSNPLMFLANNLETLFELLITTSSPDMKEYLKTRLDSLGLKLEADHFTYQPDAYFEQKERLNAFLHGQEYLIENIIVNEVFAHGIPLNGKDNLWDAYMLLCILYSLLKALLTMSADSPKSVLSREKLVEGVILWARISLHAIDNRMDGFVKRMHENESDTLAHMAILING